MTLTDPSHAAAADRQRRIILEYDAYDPGELLGTDFDDWLDFRFGVVDQPGSQIDAIMWELHPGSAAAYPSDLLPYPGLTSLRTWLDQGIDWLERVVAETKRRGLEVWWTHRISEVDLDADSNQMTTERSPMKIEHPDWTLKTWWWQGMWNLAVPEVRSHKVAVLRELAERYDFDGIQINYARHLPVLPVGRQWELRDAPTELMRGVRDALNDIAAARGRPILLGAKVPETVDGCRTDGLDVCTWANEGLVDLLTIGSRTFTMDIAAYRQELAEAGGMARQRSPKLYPCYDDHHASDAYRHVPLQTVRGVVGNWLAQGADGVVTFNWSNALAEVYQQHDLPALNLSAAHAPAYLEMGSAETMAGKDTTFVTERRGVFPWSEGYFCKNEHFALPLILAHAGTPSVVSTRVDVDVSAARGVELGVVVSNMQPDDSITAHLNGAELAQLKRDDSHKDPQIFTPEPQPPAGRATLAEPDPNQRLTLLRYAVDAAALTTGPNEISLQANRAGPYPIGADLKVEKVEIGAHF